MQEHNFAFTICIQMTFKLEQDVASAQNPDVVFDSNLNFRKHIYPKHLGHTSIISATCVECEKVCS